MCGSFDVASSENVLRHLPLREGRLAIEGRGVLTKYFH